MNAAPSPADPRAARGGWEMLAIAASVLAIAILGLMVPGLGLLLGFALGFTAFRRDTRMRRLLIGFGAGITVIAIAASIISHQSGGGEFKLGPPIRIDRPLP